MDRLYDADTKLLKAYGLMRRPIKIQSGGVASDTE